MTDAKLQELVEYVEGGICESLEEACAAIGVDYDKLCPADLDAIDDKLFVCEECGWLQPMEQCADDTAHVVCDDCYEDEDDY